MSELSTLVDNQALGGKYGEAIGVFGSNEEMMRFVTHFALISRDLSLVTKHLKLKYVEENPEGFKAYSRAFTDLIEFATIECQKGARKYQEAHKQ